MVRRQHIGAVRAADKCSLAPPLFPNITPHGGVSHALPPGGTCGIPGNPTLAKKHERRQLANHDTIMAGQPGMARGRSSRTRRRSGRKQPRNAPIENRQRLSTGEHQYQYARLVGGALACLPILCDESLARFILCSAWSVISF